MPNPFLGLGFNSWSTKYSRGSAAAQSFLQYTTTSSTSSFTLLSSGTVNYEVDWGDGTTESLTTNNPTHAYSSAGEYTIRITPAEGSTYRPYFNTAASDTNIAAVAGTGGSQIGNTLYRAWYGASNMTSFGAIDTSSVTQNFTETWRDCSSLTSFPVIDTSNAGTFNSSWKNCTSLTSFPVLDFSSATALTSAWEDCTGLLSFPVIDPSNVTNFANAWDNCSSLTEFPALDFSSGTNFANAWNKCTSLTTFPANMFDNTGSIFQFNNAFANTALTAQSIENVLTSLDTNGATGKNIRFSGTSAGKSTWSTAANTAYDNLVAKSWTIYNNA